MQHRTVSTRAPHLALLLAALALLMGTAPAHAASSIEMDARAMMGGRYEVGGWAAIAVTLVNEGEPTEGYLSAETRSGVMQRFVEMPAGARKAVTLYVQPEAFQRRLTVRYEEPNGVVQSEVELRVLDQSGGQLAIVGDGGGTIRPQLGGADGRPEAITLTAADLPERPEPLSGLTALIWAADSTTLTDDQRRSVARWIADGGQLVVIGGADWQTRTAGMTDLLPLDDLAAVDGVSQGPLAAWAGVDDPAVAEATVVAGTTRPDARALITADDGTVLVSMRSIGAGRVILIGSDLATDAHRGWPGSPALWSRLIPNSAPLDQFWGGGLPAREEAENSMSQALGNVPSLEVPPAELLLAVIVAYILLIGPISYALLRRLDRRELAWVTAPLLVVLFTACSYGIGSTLKGGDVIVNQISLIRSSDAGGTATVQSYAGIFSPERSTFDLSVEADALMGQLRSPNMPNERVSTGVVAEQGDPARLRGLSIGVFGFEGVRADAVVEHQPGLGVSWTSDDDDLTGTVTNLGDEPLSDVAYISSAGGTRIGDLDPGETATFTVRRNVNGSSASDGVYGFGGFGNNSERERTTMLRRQVIDALVGYGAFAPGMDIDDGSRGPFLIGWRTTPGPLPIEVDGQAAVRLNHTVEAIAVRPASATGEVTIQPGRMSVTILDYEGDASNAGPGMAAISDGAATFGIALPLEASTMVASEIEILAGPDPGMVIVEQGGIGGGFWPPGYEIELRDPRSGEWSQLGDLNRESHFELDDPAAAINATGRIDVRVRGAGGNPNFGPNTFFVSARVSGVIGE